MNATTKLTLNLQRPNYAAVAYAVQGDTRTRDIEARLVDGSEPWYTPTDALAIVRYVKPDGTVGFYDTLEGGGPAVVTSGDTATITLAQQALAVPGDVIVQLNYYTPAGEKITTFNFRVCVQREAVTDMEITSNDYFNVLTEAIAEGAAVAQQLTFPIPVANGGTGATTPAGALAGLGLSGMRWQYLSVPANASAQVTVGMSRRGILFTGGNTATVLSLTAFNVGATGALLQKAAVASDLITVTAESGVITIANDSTAVVAAYLLYV